MAESQGSPESTPDESERTSATVCPFCAVGCTLAPSSADSSGNRARGVAGPVNRGGRLCKNGIRAFNAFDPTDRLTNPLVRTNGDLVPASWSEALDRAAAGLTGVRRAHGPDGLAFLGAPHCSNEENYLLSKLARVLGTNNVDNRARICHASGMGALESRLGYPAMTNSLADLAAADVILAIGANPATQQPIAFDSYVRPAVNNGTTLIHIEPAANRTTRLADIHLAPRPGTDAAVVSALSALSSEAGGVDESFVESRTEGHGAYLDDLEALDIGRIAADADVPKGTLEAIAARITSADRVAVIAATGIEEDGGATTTADALIDLLLLTGNFGRPGTGMNVLRGLNNEQGASDMGCRPDALPGHDPVSDRSARERVAREWDLLPSGMPATPGLDEQEALGAFGESVFGALVVGENPAIEKRADGWISDRLDALETLVVCDVTESETTARADVVFPAATGLEKQGTTTNLDRRIQALHAIATPPGEARSDFSILRDLGVRMAGDGFEYGTPAEAFAELERVSPIHEGTVGQAIENGGVQWPVRNANHEENGLENGGRDEDGNADAGTPILYTESFATPTGTAAFAGVPLLPVGGTSAGTLSLVVSSRAGGFGTEGDADERLRVSPIDAERLALADGDRVRVSNGTNAIRTTLSTSTGIGEGTAALHADVADPLVRNGGTDITIDEAPAASGPEGERR